MCADAVDRDESEPGKRPEDAEKQQEGDDSNSPSNSPAGKDASDGEETEAVRDRDPPKLVEIELEDEEDNRVSVVPSQS